jgi:MoxR-like ATPase
MPNIKKFDQFVNEDYSFKGMISGVGNWIKKLVDKIRGGEIKKIPAYQSEEMDNKWKAGSPMINFYQCTPGQKSLEQQVEDTYKVKFESRESNYDQDLDEAGTQKEYEIPKNLRYPDAEAGVLDWRAPQIEEEIRDRFENLVSGGYDKPLFIFGAPGIGKTEIIARAANDLCVKLITVDLQFMDPADFLGIPSGAEVPQEYWTAQDIKKRTGAYSAIGKGVTRQNPPVWLPLDNGDPIEIEDVSGRKVKSEGPGGIIFFDELNRANEPVLNAMMNLLQGRRVGTEYDLPSKWLIVAAGNRPSDDVSGRIQDLGTALSDRCDIINYVASPGDWIEWVKTSPVELKGAYGKTAKEIVIPELLSFMEFSKDYFHTLSTETMGRKFASPRGWIDASKNLYSKLQSLRRKGINTIDKKKLLDVFTMSVGRDAAAAFVEFWEVSKSIPLKDVLLVFSEPDKAPLPIKQGGVYKPDNAYAVIAAIVDKSREINPDGKITADQFGKAIDYSIRLDSAEYGTAFTSLLLSKHNYVPKSGPDYMKHIERYMDHYFPEK